MNHFKGQNQRKSATLEELFLNWDKDNCTKSTLIQEYIYREYGKEFCHCRKEKGILTFMKLPNLSLSKIGIINGQIDISCLTNEQVDLLTPKKDFTPLESFRKVKKYFTKDQQQKLKEIELQFFYNDILFSIEEYSLERRIVIPSLSIVKGLKDRENVSSLFDK